MMPTMTHMTYRELAEYIATMSDEHKDNNVTVFVAGVGEFYPVRATMLTADAESDELDVGHPYMVV